MTPRFPGVPTRTGRNKSWATLKCAIARGVYLPVDLSEAAAAAELFHDVQQVLGPVSALVVAHTYDPPAE